MSVVTPAACRCQPCLQDLWSAFSLGEMERESGPLDILHTYSLIRKYEMTISDLRMTVEQNVCEPKDVHKSSSLTVWPYIDKLA